jgi:hypothetical protein
MILDGTLSSIIYSMALDVLEFANSHSMQLKNSFFIVLNAVCWSLWKCRNDIIFNHKSMSTIRNMICLILSLVNY